MKQFKVRCPKCGKVQNYLTNRTWIGKARKVCITCEKSFRIHKDINHSTIINKIKGG